MFLIHRQIGTISVNRGRRGGNYFLHPVTYRTLQNIQGTANENLNRFTRGFCASCDAKSSLVKNVVDALYRAVYKIDIANIAFDYHQATFGAGLFEISPRAPDKVVQHTDFTRASI